MSKTDLGFNVTLSTLHFETTYWDNKRIYRTKYSENRWQNISLQSEGMEIAVFDSYGVKNSIKGLFP